MAGFLAEHDIVVNCVLQDTDAPLTFVTEDELAAFAPGSLIIDVSCDEGMGFSWARPTSFAEPDVHRGRQRRATTPSTTARRTCGTPPPGRSARRCCRTCGRCSAGPDAWDADQTIHRAIEIRDGVIQNPSILSFQHRVRRVPAPASVTYGDYSIVISA